MRAARGEGLRRNENRKRTRLTGRILGTPVATGVQRDVLRLAHLHRALADFVLAAALRARSTQRRPTKRRGARVLCQACTGRPVCVYLEPVIRRTTHSLGSRESRGPDQERRWKMVVAKMIREPRPSRWRGRPSTTAQHPGQKNVFLERSSPGTSRLSCALQLRCLEPHWRARLPGGARTDPHVPRARCRQHVSCASAWEETRWPAHSPAAIEGWPEAPSAPSRHPGSREPAHGSVCSS